MGKLKRQLKKKQREEGEAMRREENRELEKKLSEEMADGKYAEAIETLAGLVQGEDMKPEFMYKAAYAYFMLGDYERAAQWIDNTLKFSPANIDARVLLARLCILQDREEAALSIIDFILKNFGSGISDEQSEDIDDIVGFYGRSEPDKIRKKYPEISRFLKLDEQKEAPTPSRISDISPTSENVPVQKPAPAPSTEGSSGSGVKPAAPEGESAKTAAAAPKKSAIEILRALKEKVSAAKKESEHPAPAAEDTTASKESTVEVERDEILKKPGSLREKVRLLNSLAAGYYYQKDIKSAKTLLMAALTLDEGYDAVLRNMAMVLAEEGEKDKALKVAARMKAADFILIRTIRDM